MRWERGTSDRNIEDRRGMRGGMGLPIGRGGLGLGGLLLIAVLSLVFKQDFFSLLDDSAGGPAGVGAPAPGGAHDDQYEFVKFVFNDTQSTWSSLLRDPSTPYREATLVLFDDVVQSACGMAEAATGPFYCPGDQKVYIDLRFYQELRSRFGAGGDFAQAYVIAHEVGHHVQHLAGADRALADARRRDAGRVNAESVALELQADCLAGVWGRSTDQRGLLDATDVDEALDAAAAIGDDRLQRMATGRVAPDQFTHGSSAQRVAAFRRGFTSGDPNACAAR